MTIKNEPNYYHCKVCGANIEHLYNHRCPYCRTLLDFNENIEKTINIKPEELIDIELRDVQYHPEYRILVLVFSGYKVATPKIYEVQDNNTFVSTAEVYVNPPKGAFCIQLKIDELEKYGISYILHYLESLDVRPREIWKIRQQLEKDRDITRWINYSL